MLLSELEPRNVERGDMVIWDDEILEPPPWWRPLLRRRHRRAKARFDQAVQRWWHEKGIV